MESITIKVDKNLAGEVENAMKNMYSTKTEFIREAIRDKINSLRQEQIKQNILASLGSGKAKTNLSDRQVREIIGTEFAQKHKINLD